MDKQPTNLEVLANNVAISDSNRKVTVSKGISFSKLAALLIVTMVLSVLIGAGSMLLVFHFYPDLTRDTVTNVTRLEKEVSITDQGIADAVDKVYNSVVIVKTYKREKLYATGTGFVYKKTQYDNKEQYTCQNR